MKIKVNWLCFKHHVIYTHIETSHHPTNYLSLDFYIYKKDLGKQNFETSILAVVVLGIYPGEENFMQTQKYLYTCEYHHVMCTGKGGNNQDAPDRWVMSWATCAHENFNLRNTTGTHMASLTLYPTLLNEKPWLSTVEDSTRNVLYMAEWADQGDVRKLGKRITVTGRRRPEGSLGA